MVIAHKVYEELAPRRAASVPALDARLSVWGQATREAVQSRANALARGAVLFAEEVGRSAAKVQGPIVEGSDALLALGADSLAALASNLLPGAVPQSCRLLWVDPERLEGRILNALAPAVDAARTAVRKRQALYRRRARLWKDHPDRLEELRDEVEGLRVPKCPPPAEVAVILSSMFKGEPPRPRLVR
ncbi:MAG: hypothetical protein HY791_29050 [Deltaproteobacteria bacterium]|nr:hypothetical protein [Deltaproteobacteria bacterium]